MSVLFPLSVLFLSGRSERAPDPFPCLHEIRVRGCFLVAFQDSAFFPAAFGVLEKNLLASSGPQKHNRPQVTGPLGPPPLPQNLPLALRNRGPTPNLPCCPSPHMFRGHPAFPLSAPIFQLFSPCAPHYFLQRQQSVLLQRFC